MKYSLLGIALAGVMAIGAVSADEGKDGCCGTCGDQKISAPADKPTTAPSTQPVNKTCPVMGGPADPKVTTTYEGRTIGFCCSDCIPTFKKEPEKYVKNLK